MASQPFTAIVTVTTDSQEHAEQVLSERLLHDEDYGFDYTVDFNELQPESATRGVILDAPVVREELDMIIFQGSEEIRERVRAMSDARINHFISSLDDPEIWEHFNEMRTHVVTALIRAVTLEQILS